MIKMCSFDKSNNSAIVDAFKQPINRRERENFLRVAYPVNGFLPKGHALQWVEVHKKHNVCVVWSGGALENGASHVNEYDWLLKYMTGGRLEVDFEKLSDWRRLHV